MSEQKILNIVLSPVVYRSQILLLKRAKEPFKDLWGMPGGKVEFGENIDTAIEREIREETGLPVKFTAVRGIVNETFHDSKTDKIEAQSIIFVCEVRPEHNKHVDSVEGKLAWFKLKDWQKLKEQIIPSDYLMVERFIIRQKRDVTVNKVKMLQGKEYKIARTDL